MQKTGIIRKNYVKKKEARPGVRNMCKVLLVVECEYDSENSRVRLYLSQVQKIRNPAAGMFQKKASAVAAKLVLSVVLTVPAAAWAVISAFLERGYRAYGGECMFIFMVFVAVYWALGRVLPDEDMDML